MRNSVILKMSFFCKESVTCRPWSDQVMSPTLEKTNLGNNILSPIHIGRIVKRGNYQVSVSPSVRNYPTSYPVSSVISSVMVSWLGVRPGCQVMRHDCVQIQPPAAPDHRAAPVVVMGDRQLLCGVGWQVGELPSDALSHHRPPAQRTARPRPARSGSRPRLAAIPSSCSGSIPGSSGRGNRSSAADHRASDAAPDWYAAHRAAAKLRRQVDCDIIRKVCAYCLKKNDRSG